MSRTRLIIKRGFAVMLFLVTYQCGEAVGEMILKPAKTKWKVVGD